MSIMSCADVQPLICCLQSQYASGLSAAMGITISQHNWSRNMGDRSIRL
jgi:hypothetical protein